MSDWVENFMSKTSRLPSPESFRLWAAITTISGVLERRVWTEGSGGPLYPNIFTLLIGAPSSGKTQAINRTRDIWSNIPELKVSPDNMTKAAFIERLAASMRSVANPDGSGMLIYNALCLQSPEFGVLIPNHDLEFISIMNHIYDSPPFYQEDRVSLDQPRKITKPHMTMIAGTQPDFLSTFLPEKAWGMGFCSRLIMIHGEKPPPSESFSLVAVNGHRFTPEVVNRELSTLLQPLMQLKGPFEWNQDAVDLVDTWWRSGGPPTPTHPKLEHYIGRRHINIMKLAMISAMSESQRLVVVKRDVERAVHWLTSAEELMPDIFNGMTQRSDFQILEDIAVFVEQVYAKQKKAITKTQMYSFLKNKVQVERIPRLIDAAVGMGNIEKGMYGDDWIPRRKN